MPPRAFNPPTAHRILLPHRTGTELYVANSPVNPTVEMQAEVRGQGGKEKPQVRAPEIVRLAGNLGRDFMHVPLVAGWRQQPTHDVHQLLAELQTSRPDHPMADLSSLTSKPRKPSIALAIRKLGGFENTVRPCSLSAPEKSGGRRREPWSRSSWPPHSGFAPFKQSNTPPT